MTHDDLTDFFAGLAMLGLVQKGMPLELIPKEAYLLADVMMYEREGRNKDDSV